MIQNIFNTAILATLFLILFAMGEVLHRKFRVKAEVTRKIVHLVTGLLVLLFPQMLGSHWYVLFLCGSFFFILAVSRKIGMLPSINAVDRVTQGSLLYPVVVYGAFLVYEQYGDFVFYYLPILILAICDPLAGLAGKKWVKGQYTIFGKTKTLIGSGFFFISALATSFFLPFLVSHASVQEAAVLAILIAVFTTIAEAFSHGGFDNLTIPLTAELFLILGKEYFLFF